MPYLRAADSRNSKTSRLVWMPASRSSLAPRSPTIKWSQWILAGIAVVGRRQVINCSRAI